MWCYWLASSLCLLSTNKLVCGGRSGTIWLLSYHPGYCGYCTLVVVEEIPHLHVKCFEYPEKRYINVTHYYYYYYYYYYCVISLTSSIGKFTVNFCNLPFKLSSQCLASVLLLKQIKAVKRLKWVLCCQLAWSPSQTCQQRSVMWGKACICSHCQ